MLIKRIAQNGPEFKALQQSASHELLACHLYTSTEIAAMQTPGQFKASWMQPGHHFLIDIFATEIDSPVVGCVQLYGRDDRTGVVEFLYVEKDFRHGHVGSALVQEAVKEVQARGLPAIEVFTMVREPKAVAFWTAFFRPEPPNLPGHVILLGQRLEAIGWRLPPAKFLDRTW